MICPKCNFVMSDFDTECPRCHGRGLPSQPAAPNAPSIPNLVNPANVAVPKNPPSQSHPATSSNNPEANKQTGQACCGCITLAVIILIILSLFSGSDTNKEVVKNSEWDASVTQVKDYLHRNLNDADSVQYVEWSRVNVVNSDTGTYKYWVRCKYRAKNVLGAYIIQNQIFYLDKDGKVVNVKDLE